MTHLQRNLSSPVRLLLIALAFITLPVQIVHAELETKKPIVGITEKSESNVSFDVILRSASGDTLRLSDMEVHPTIPAKKPTVGITERLGSTVPLDIELRSETGDTLLLSDIVDRPTFLGLVYYTCPGVCNPFLEGMAKVFDQTAGLPGKDYNIITLSFSQLDTPATALRRKNEVMGAMKRDIPDGSWRFLTADAKNIRRITEAVGFQYTPSQNVDGNFLHRSSLITLSPSGKIVRYMSGTDFLPAVIQIAIAEATEGRIGATITKAIAYCFDVDPVSRKYVLDIKKVFGISITIGGLFFWGALTASKPKRHST